MSIKHIHEGRLRSSCQTYGEFLFFLRNENKKNSDINRCIVRFPSKKSYSTLAYSVGIKCSAVNKLTGPSAPSSHQIKSISLLLRACNSLAANINNNLVKY